MSKEPIIETERLILRPITLDDARDIFDWNSDERVTKYMSYSTFTDISQTIDWIKSTLTDEKEWNWAFVLKSENKVIGTGGIGQSGKMTGYWGMGYNFHYNYWGSGYCTEAMKAIIDFVYKNLNVKKSARITLSKIPEAAELWKNAGLNFSNTVNIPKLTEVKLLGRNFIKRRLSKMKFVLITGTGHRVLYLRK